MYIADVVNKDLCLCISIGTIMLSKGRECILNSSFRAGNNGSHKEKPLKSQFLRQAAADSVQYVNNPQILFLNSTHSGYSQY
jgi:hypothetical protein